MYNENERIIKKFEQLSERYHKISFLFYELAQSLRLVSGRYTTKEFKKYIKEELNLDWDKIKDISGGFDILKLRDFKKK